ncbi:hypothetical protein [Arthrobacter sp. AL12]|uniref:hypothetical protein n=1 Tax=Arthrobacter sp. AL12 TaxID=3042241 RepID=UPI00249AF835|nr:hypothetical protein [Arthrobacter sp. AL12]MDI3210743.1 hypothetical protein [Arthrobacter sp. AL12]
MNHKLRVLVRVDADPGLVTLEVTGCLTQSDFPSLLHIMRRAGRLGAGTGVIVDLHGSSHLDPETLLQLRSIADGSASAGPGGAARAGTAAEKQPIRVALAEPADLPICLLHVGSEGGVPAGLDDACSPLPAELNAVNGQELAEYFEGALDPAATVRALSDAALCQLADALYRHLDTSSPSFGAHTWYELAAEELQNRHLGGAGDPAEGELAAGLA